MVIYIVSLGHKKKNFVVIQSIIKNLFKILR